MAPLRAVVSRSTFVIGITSIPSPFATLLTTAVEAQSHEPACAASGWLRQCRRQCDGHAMARFASCHERAISKRNVCFSAKRFGRNGGWLPALENSAGTTASEIPVVSGREAELLHPPPERDGADVERLCRLASISAKTFERSLDRGAFLFPQVEGVVAWAPARLLRDLRRQVANANRGGVGKDDRALDRMLQLTHVPGPLVAHQDRHRIGR